MKHKTWQKNVLSALAIAGGGFLLFNVAFILAAGVISGINRLIGLISGQKDIALNMRFGLYLFVILVLIASWFIFRSKLPALVKAVYLPMPLMVVLIVQAIHLFEMPKWIPISIGAAVVAAVLAFVWKKKLPWMFYFATVYTGAVALLVAIFNIEI